MDKLEVRKVIDIRFSEVDSLRVVWHGHYVKYFEDGREAFGKKYGLGYMDVFKEGYTTPITQIECNFKRPILYGDEIEVITKFENSPAAKICFSYELKNTRTGELIATGSSIQVFLDDKNELYLIMPEFFSNWKSKFGLEK